MRKDMRMGFGVGGVLLAVIIVAILVIHRNQGKQVAALDKTGTATSESTTIGANDAQPGTPAPDAQPDLKPADPIPLAAKETAARVADPKIPGVADDSIKSDGTQWDRLFASSSDAQPKSQLRRPKLTQPPVTDATPADTSVQVAEVAPKHDADNAVTASDKVAGSGKSSHTADSTGAREHVVKSGESFYTIAKAAYGDSKHYKDLQAANPSIDSGKLRPGMTIKIPALSTLSKPVTEAKAKKPATHTGGIALSARTTTAAPAAGAAADGKTYTVKSGDSLYKIARDLYGSGEKGDDIYALNRDVIGNDSTKLKIGQVLHLPPKQAAASAR